MLTLHDSSNTRVLGYDNAHGVKLKKKHAARKIIWDRCYKRKAVESYEFENASQLLEDFWASVEKYFLKIRDNNESYECWHTITRRL